MKRLLALIAVGALTGAASSTALACWSDKVADSGKTAITTALDSEPVTPKPGTKSGS